MAQNPFPDQAGPGQVHLRILETTDLHAHIQSYDYFRDRPSDTTGLARVATLVSRARAEAPNVLLVDDGDFLQGNPMGDLAVETQAVERGGLHPVIEAMNVLGFDAATLGNHDFNYGLDFLLGAISGADFPVVTANVARGRLAADPCADDTLIAPYVLLDRQVTDGAGQRHDLRIGFIGFVPPQIMAWDNRFLAGRVEARDIVGAARAWVPRMRRAGADIVIALSHSGIGPAEQQEGMENASVPLARVPGIDALMTGHSHLVFPGEDFAGLEAVDHRGGTIAGKPAVMAGRWGSHLGVMDLLLTREGGAWRVAGHHVETRPIAGPAGPGEKTAPVPAAPEVIRAVAAAHDATLVHIRQPIGRTEVPLHTYFALIGPSRAVDLIAEAQLRHAARALEGSPLAGLPLLAAASPFKAGGRGGPGHFIDIPPGPLVMRHVADLYPYPNTLCVLRLDGTALRLWLERAASIFNHVMPGQCDVPLINPEMPSYDFDTIRGLTYELDLSSPATFDGRGGPRGAEAGRIRALRLGGRPLDPAQEVLLVTNSYRTGGGGSFPGVGPERIVHMSQMPIPDVILRHLAEIGPVRGPAPEGWRFRPVAGASAVFESGPGALAYLDAPEAPLLEQAGSTDGGFLRLRLRL
ncbi:bifunctional 2',3'-cyclic-nucleotide 2'-phosphodiesterase/3'-nucleotidase [Maritimibacter sp. 55A14]|uniref:bifunctional 2',3'-cyclic-nucleotide 2'-phosphodiesterase/3'-nucleotidase n=1 Tax=Maritimibacter sp. 55A14 TaxID=2174844 RepID=UPI000D603E8E|nr:bifunctional 2',3'-cyclic-nucleotide 2'-phosphodiesterase/3'-nucleotidase [Maritimibacter sp. 55A14]PWE32281.1 bifunctional 2',3'-cyclic-nucleotide 2'-phosphodiesterase/3'-nucleotidase [Maritimibacter sp. 55A14]